MSTIIIPTPKDANTLLDMVIAASEAYCLKPYVY
jgi:hypothetical protein